MDETCLVCFTDGACLGNGRANARASYAVVWPRHSEYNGGGPLLGQATNNRAEYTAFIHAMETADRIDPERTTKLIVYTDSKLLHDMVSKNWIRTWKKNEWKKSNKQPVLNLDLVIRIEELLTNRKCTEMRHVRAHTGKQDWESVQNDLVDKLAASYLSDATRSSS